MSFDLQCAQSKKELEEQVSGLEELISGLNKCVSELNQRTLQQNIDNKELNNRLAGEWNRTEIFFKQFSPTNTRATYWGLGLNFLNLGCLTALPYSVFLEGFGLLAVREERMKRRSRDVVSISTSRCQ